MTRFGDDREDWGIEGGEEPLVDLLESLAATPAGAVSIPFLGKASRQTLLAATLALGYRRARERVGEGGTEVRQDFELTMDVPVDSILHDFRRDLSRRIRRGAARMAHAPLPDDWHLNDLVVQRYAAGSAGISPHRDHKAYQGVVLLLTLCGDARLYVCRDRQGTGAIEVDIAPGRLLALAAPGFAGGDQRPFHFVDAVRSARVSLGLRWDRRKPAEADALGRPAAGC